MVTVSPHGGSRPWIPQLLSLLAIAAVALLALHWRQPMPINHDVNWFVIAADRMRHGGSYTLDFFEVNMPLAIALYIPVHLLRDAFALTLPQAVLAWTFGAGGMACLLAWACFPRAHRASFPGLAAVTVLALAVFALPGYELAEREHFIGLLALPWLFLLGRPPEAGSVALRIAATLLAAVACFLKPHYAPLPFLLLLLRVPGMGWRAAMTGQEAWTLAGAALAYALLVAWRFPEWFEVARWARELYHEYRGTQAARFWTTESLLPLLAALGLLLALVRWRKALAPMLAPFLLAAAYAVIAYFLQGKGWRYQLLPAALFTCGALAALWIAPRPGPPGRRGAASLMTTGVALGSLLLVAHAWSVNRHAPRLADLPQSQIGQLLANARPGDAVYVFSTSAVPFFPSVMHLELEWASRYSPLWPLAALGRTPAKTVDAEDARRHQPYVAPFVASVAADFRRFRPDLAVVDLRPDQFGLPGRFDFLAFFLSSPEFAQEWSHYVRVGATRDFALYVRKKDA
jgi:hypothetical protein